MAELKNNPPFSNENYAKRRIFGCRITYKLMKTLFEKMAAIERKGFVHPIFEGLKILELSRKKVLVSSSNVDLYEPRLHEVVFLFLILISYSIGINI